MSAPATTRKGIIARWFASRGATDVPQQSAEPRASPLSPSDDGWDSWLSEPLTLQALAGTENRPARSRLQVYAKWQDMLADPIIVSAMRLHVTAALGGDEATGEMVFIEATPDATGPVATLIPSLAADLQPLFNRIAPTVSFNAITFGDGYGRLYAEPKVGVRDIHVDELVLPPLVQPYERGNTTVGFSVATGPRFEERLNILQMARMKMPRLMHVPQSRVIETALRMSLRTDRLEDLPVRPALAGGSFLDGAEGAYDKFSAAWAGLVGQRVRDSIDESLISVQQAGMTSAQRKSFKAALSRLFERSNAYINQVVQSGRAVFGRIYHFIPVSSDKQLTEIRGAADSGRNANFTIDDVMMHARLLASVLGHDLSMLGFADQLSGGLGDGGFFRVSAQAAERARAIRGALAEFCDHVVSVHLLLKHGIEVDAQGPKPWRISFFSGISALESEQAKTKAEKVNGAAVMAQTLAQLKDLGIEGDAAVHFLKTELGLDEKTAKLYADAMKKANEEAKKAEAGGGFGGGPGGGGFGEGGPFGGGDEEPPADEPPAKPTFPKAKPGAEG